MGWFGLDNKLQFSARPQSSLMGLGVSEGELGHGVWETSEVELLCLCVCYVDQKIGLPVL